MKKDRGKVWLGVAAVVENKHGQWLIVKKSYSGLKGRWSLPAGFVQEGETIADAAQREVLEETGIHCIVAGLVGFRSGVIRDEISDNMAILACTPMDASEQIVIQEREILEATWKYPKEIAQDELASVMLMDMAKNNVQQHQLPVIEDVDPGDVFGYTDYKLYFKMGDC